MAVEHFVDDDTGYERWLRENRGGFVVNAKRSPTPSYLKLHAADCVHVTQLQAGYTTWTAGDYCKVCSTSRRELAQWAESVGALEQGCYCVA